MQINIGIVVLDSYFKVTVKLKSGKRLGESIWARVELQLDDDDFTRLDIHNYMLFKS